MLIIFAIMKSKIMPGLLLKQIQGLNIIKYILNITTYASS